MFFLCQCGPFLWVLSTIYEHQFTFQGSGSDSKLPKEMKRRVEVCLCLSCDWTGLSMLHLLHDGSWGRHQPEQGEADVKTGT